MKKVNIEKQRDLEYYLLCMTVLQVGLSIFHQKQKMYLS